MRKRLWLVPLALVALIGLIILITKEVTRPISQESLSASRIFAYRSWQSVGVLIHQGDELEIEAKGTWLYTPGEYHGPEGHRRYKAPGFYPLPDVRGGALIGRVGENGEIFYVGRRLIRQAGRGGLLYLRIDDDILSDNDGWVTVDVTVRPAETSD